MRIDSRNRRIDKEIVPKIIRSAYCLIKSFLSSSPVRDLGSDMTTTTTLANIFMKIRVCSITKLHALEYVGFHFDAFHLGALILWEDSGLGKYQPIGEETRNIASQTNLFYGCFAFLGADATIKSQSIFHRAIRAHKLTQHHSPSSSSLPIEDSQGQLHRLSEHKHINDVRKQTRCRHAVGDAEVVSNRQCPREPHCEFHMILVCTAMSTLGRETREWIITRRRNLCCLDFKDERAGYRSKNTLVLNKNDILFRVEVNVPFVILAAIRSL